MKSLIIIAAVGKNGVIGNKGKLPWHIPEDLQHFKKVTSGHAIIMGRKTWDSIGKPLPNRRNIVISRDKNLVLDGAEVYQSLEEAIDNAAKTDKTPFVIGGSLIYELAMPLATKMIITEVDYDGEGDSYFPKYDKNRWVKTSSVKGNTNNIEFVTYHRGFPGDSSLDSIF